MSAATAPSATPSAPRRGPPRRLLIASLPLAPPIGQPWEGVDPADQWVPPSGSGGRGAGRGAMAAGMAVPGAGSGAVPVAVPGAGSGSVPAATRLQAYAWCREFLAGSWKLIGPDDFAIAPVRYGGRRGVPPRPVRSLPVPADVPGSPRMAPRGVPPLPQPAPHGVPRVPHRTPVVAPGSPPMSPHCVPLQPHYPPIVFPGRPLMAPHGVPPLSPDDPNESHWCPITPPSHPLGAP